MVYSQVEMDKKKRELDVLLDDPARNYSIRELADILDVSTSSIRMWIKKREREKDKYGPYCPLLKKPCMKGRCQWWENICK